MGIATNLGASADDSPAVDALFVGPVYCDLIFAGLPHLPGRGEEVHAGSFLVSPGGTASRCVAAARLGASSGLVSAVGDDLFGQELLRSLSTEPGLDLRWVSRRAGAHTPVTVAAVDDADRTFITYEQPSWSSSWPLTGVPPRVKTCHVDAATELPGWVSDVRTQGTTIVAGVGWDVTGAWSTQVLEGLAAIDVFCPNAVEAMRYTRTDDVAAAIKVLGERVPLTVVTNGAKGALALDSGTGELAEIPALDVPVVDPTGAGDVFVASFMVAGLGEWTLAERLRFAVVCAGLSVQRLGGAASAPTRADVRTWLRALPADQRSAYHFMEAGLEEPTGNADASGDRP